MKSGSSKIESATTKSTTTTSSISKLKTILSKSSPIKPSSKTTITAAKIVSPVNATPKTKSVINSSPKKSPLKLTAAKKPLPKIIPNPVERISSTATANTNTNTNATTPTKTKLVKTPATKKSPSIASLKKTVTSEIGTLETAKVTTPSKGLGKTKTTASPKAPPSKKSPLKPTLAKKASPMKNVKSPKKEPIKKVSKIAVASPNKDKKTSTPKKAVSAKKVTQTKAPPVSKASKKPATPTKVSKMTTTSSIVHPKIESVKTPTLKRKDIDILPTSAASETSVASKIPIQQQKRQKTQADATKLRKENIVLESIDTQTQLNSSSSASPVMASPSTTHYGYGQVQPPPSSYWHPSHQAEWRMQQFFHRQQHWMHQPPSFHNYPPPGPWVNPYFHGPSSPFPPSAIPGPGSVAASTTPINYQSKDANHSSITPTMKFNAPQIAGLNSSTFAGYPHQLFHSSTQPMSSSYDARTSPSSITNIATTAQRNDLPSVLNPKWKADGPFMSTTAKTQPIQGYNAALNNADATMPYSKEPYNTSTGSIYNALAHDATGGENNNYHNNGQAYENQNKAPGNFGPYKNFNGKGNNNSRKDNSNSSNNTNQPAKQYFVKMEDATYYADVVADTEPRDPAEMYLFSQMQQMGFMDKREIMSSIRRLQQQQQNPIGSYPSSDDVMCDIISQREEAEEARKEDMARSLSEQTRKEEAKYLREAKRQQEQDMLRTATLEEWKTTDAMFPSSWVLQCILDDAPTKWTLPQSTGTDNCSTRNKRNAVVSSNEVAFTLDSMSPFSNAEVKAALLELLLLEKKAQKWYGHKLPKWYFTINVAYCLLEAGIAENEKEIYLVRSINEQVETLHRIMFDLSEQINDVPREFLKVYDEHTYARKNAIVATGSTESRLAASNEHITSNNIVQNDDDDDDDSVVCLIVSPSKIDDDDGRNSSATNVVEREGKSQNDRAVKKDIDIIEID